MTTPYLSLHDFKQSPALTWQDLFTVAGISRLDQLFQTFLAEYDPALAVLLTQYRAGTATIAVSEIILALAPCLEEFLAQLFKLSAVLKLRHEHINTANTVAWFNQHFMGQWFKKYQGRGLDLLTLPEFGVIDAWLDTELHNHHLAQADKELAIALLGQVWLGDPAAHQCALSKLAQWCYQAIHTVAGRALTANWALLRQRQRLDHQALLPVQLNPAGVLAYEHDALIGRDGFALSDAGFSERAVQSEIYYCMYCHNNQGDFCRTGFPRNKHDYAQGFKVNPLGVELVGCPLEEKISEMHTLKRHGLTIAPLAVVMIDNPLCPATGHRICNDCMKACIYQKQEPVNIPAVETKVLLDVLHLPWGVEIYDLLTRWNPLKAARWMMQEFNGHKVLVAGMGPAGFTMAYHLLQEGCAVVGIDGLKIEPLPAHLVTQAIYDFTALAAPLDDRVVSGFGGVMEYGITVRWDKNFLQLIYLVLQRRAYFQVFGNLRFGGSLTIEDAWQLGFAHIVVALGAGLPQALNIPGSLAKGMRQANDFLMSLHLNNAAHPAALSGMQVRLPALIIGGGLTGVDAATEVQAYYIKQVEKVLQRYEALCERFTPAIIRRGLSAEASTILDEFLEHGMAVRAERDVAAQAGRAPDFSKLLAAWGGVTIIYRRKLNESPAYKNNHEELHHAFAQGIRYREGLTPLTVQLDQYGAAQALICRPTAADTTQLDQGHELPITLAARAILVATGTLPNVAYEFEHRGSFHKTGRYYQHYDLRDDVLVPGRQDVHCKDDECGPFTSYHQDHQRRVSLIGDSHPVFHGSVVKAIASAVRAYPKIMATLPKVVPDIAAYQEFRAQLDELFSATVLAVTPHNAQVTELVVRAPLGAQRYCPGQFYRVQNYAGAPPLVAGHAVNLEPLALLPSYVDAQAGIIKFWVFTETANARLINFCQPGQPLALMGPTGVKLKLGVEPETVLVLGNKTALPLVLSYGSALLARGSQVIFVAMLAPEDDIAYCKAQIEQATSAVVWNNMPQLQICRPQDCVTAGATIAEVLHAYQDHALAQGNTATLAAVERLYVIGTSELLRKVQAARTELYATLLSKQPAMYGSVYGPMQCMLKGVCAQCLQWQRDPATGQRTKAVFACSWQEQPLELIDMDHLDERCAQNALHEYLAQWWLDYCLATPITASGEING